jgi:RNA recognition motif-containing protein
MINIYVGNLPYSAKHDDLKELFEEFGEVNSAEIIFDRRTKRSRGYGFVEMVNAEDGKEAIDELNGSDYDGRQLRVDESQPGSKERSKAKRNGNRRVQNANNSTGIFGFIKKLFT